MKRKSIFALAAILILSCFAAGCGEVDTASPATVRFEIVSEAAEEDITVVASAGTVTREGKTAIVALENRRPLYVTFSAEGYKTVTEKVNAKDFSSDTLTRTVNLDAPLTTTVELTSNVAGTLTCSDPGAVITQKSARYIVELPGRGRSEATFTVAAEGYETRTITLGAADLASAYVFESATLVQAGKRLIELKNYSFYDPIVTRNFDILTPVATSNDYRNYQVTMDADDVIVIDGVMIKGAEIPTYGTVLGGTGSGEQAQKLYFARTDDFHMWLNSQVFFEDGGVTKEAGCNQESQFDPEQEKESILFYTKIPGPGTVHFVTEQGGEVYDETLGYYVTPYSDSVYDISADEIASGINIYDFDTQSFLNPDRTRTLYRDPNLYNYDLEGLPVSDDDASTMVYVKNEQVIEGDYIRTKQYYTNAATLVVEIEGDLEGASYVLSGSGQTPSVSGNRLRFDNFVPGTEGFFELQVKVTDLSEPEKPVTAAEETFYIEYDELTKNGDVYTLGRKLVLHGYARLENFSFDLRSYLSLLPGSYENIFMITLSLEAEPGSEDLIKTAGFYMYVHRDAKFKVVVKFGADGYNGYAQGTLKSTKYVTAAEFSRNVMSGQFSLPLELDSINEQK